MADKKSKFLTKISPLIEGQVPDFVQADHPVFVDFVRDYFKFLEAGRLTVRVVINYIATENAISTYVINEQTRSRIVSETGNGTTGMFTVGETITGKTSKATAKILVEDSKNTYLYITGQQLFQTGETITGETSKAAAIVYEYRGNPIQNIQQMLEYADVDNTLYDFLDNMRDQFMVSIPNTLADGVNKRDVIKNIKNLYTTKGTSEGHKLFMRILLGETAEIFYPNTNMLRVSDATWKQKTIIRVVPFIGTSGLECINEIITGKSSLAKAIVVNSQVVTQGANSVTEFEIDNIVGTFIDGEIITGFSFSKNIIVSFTIKEIISSTKLFNNGLLYADGEVVEVEPIGNSNASIVVDGIKTGSVSKVIVEDDGSLYEVDDVVTFTNTANLDFNANAATGFVSMVGGGVQLETGTLDDSTLTDDALLLEEFTNDTLELFSIQIEQPTTRIFVGDSLTKIFPITTIAAEYGSNAENISTETDGLLYQENNSINIFDTLQVKINETKIDAIAKDGTVTWVASGSEITFTIAPALGDIIRLSPTENEHISIDSIDGSGAFTNHKIKTNTVIEKSDTYDVLDKKFVLEYETFNNLSVPAEAGTIQKIFVNQNSGYIELPTVTVTSLSGTGAKLAATTTDIGSVKSLKIADPGFDYDKDNPPAVTGTAHFVVKDVSGTFVVNNNLTSHTGTVKGWNSTTQILDTTFENVIRFEQEQDGIFNEGIQLETGMLTSTPFSVLAEDEQDFEPYGEGDDFILDGTGIFTPPSRTFYHKVRVGRNADDTANIFYINDVSQPVLTLYSGDTHYFDLSNSTLYNNDLLLSHPFKFSETSDGTHNGGFELTSKVVATGIVKNADGPRFKIVSEDGVNFLTTENSSINLVPSYILNETSKVSPPNVVVNLETVTGTIKVGQVVTVTQQVFAGSQSQNLENIFNFLLDADYNRKNYADGTLTVTSIISPTSFTVSEPVSSFNNVSLSFTGGVTTSAASVDVGTAGAFLQIIIPYDIGELNYYCSNHSGMGNIAYTPTYETTVVDEGGSIILDSTKEGPNVSLILVEDVSFKIVSEEGKVFTPYIDAKIIAEGSSFSDFTAGYLTTETDGFLYQENILHSTTFIERSDGDVIALETSSNNSPAHIINEQFELSPNIKLEELNFNEEGVVILETASQIGNDIGGSVICEIGIDNIISRNNSNSVHLGKHLVLEDDSGDIHQEQSIDGIFEDVGDKLKLNRYHERNIGTSIFIEGNNVLKLATEESGDALILERTDSTGASLTGSSATGGTDARDKFLLDDETGNGKLTLNASSSSLDDVDGHIINQEAIDFSKNNVTITDSGGASGTIMLSNIAIGGAAADVTFTEKGSYSNINSKLGEDLIRIQDSYYYQDYSYEVQIGHSLSSYIEELKKAVHPAGYQPFGKVTLATLVSAAVGITNTGLSGDKFSSILGSVLQTIFSQVIQSRLQVPTTNTADGQVALGSRNNSFIQEDGVLRNDKISMDGFALASANNNNSTVNQRHLGGLGTIYNPRYVTANGTDISVGFRVGGYFDPDNLSIVSGDVTASTYLYIKNTPTGKSVSTGQVLETDKESINSGYDNEDLMFDINGNNISKSSPDASVTIINVIEQGTTDAKVVLSQPITIAENTYLRAQSNISSIITTEDDLQIISESYGSPQVTWLMHHIYNWQAYSGFGQWFDSDRGHFTDEKVSMTVKDPTILSIVDANKNTGISTDGSLKMSNSVISNYFTGNPFTDDSYTSQIDNTNNPLSYGATGMGPITNFVSSNSDGHYLSTYSNDTIWLSVTFEQPVSFIDEPILRVAWSTGESIIYEDDILVSELSLGSISIGQDTSANSGDNIVVNSGGGILLEDGFNITGESLLWETNTETSTDDITFGTGDGGGRIMSENSHATSDKMDRALVTEKTVAVVSSPLPMYENNILLYLADTPFGTTNGKGGISLESGSGNLTDNVIADGQLPFDEGSTFLVTNTGDNVLVELGGRVLCEAGVYAFPLGFRVDIADKIILDSNHNDETITLDNIGTFTFQNIRRVDRINLNETVDNLTWGGGEEEDNISIEISGNIISESDEHLALETTKRNRFTLEQSGSVIVENFSTYSNIRKVEIQVESGGGLVIGNVSVEDAINPLEQVNIRLEGDEDEEGIVIIDAIENVIDGSIIGTGEGLVTEEFYWIRNPKVVILEGNNSFSSKGHIPLSNYTLNSTNVITKGHVRSAEILVRSA